MSSLTSGMRLTLDRIQAEIQQAQLMSAAAGKSKRLSDPEQDMFWRKLARYEDDLRRIQRTLRGRLTTLERERANLWNVPRDLRYSARQSVDDREAVTQDLLVVAASILRELLDLYVDTSSMKPGDWQSLFQKLTEAGDKVDHALFHKVIHQAQHGPAIVAPAPVIFSLADFAPLVGLIAAIIASRLRRRP